MIKLVIFSKSLEDWCVSQVGVTVWYKNGEQHFWPLKMIHSFEFNLSEESQWPVPVVVEKIS